MSKLPAMTAPPSSARTEPFTLHFNDGSERDVIFSDVEYIVPKSMMIVSKTDLKGFITHVNPDFIETSGYEKEEIIGQPHYLLRHPHMPRAAFQELWETLKRGEIWTGAVKNLRKDGGFYWVQAVVKPVTDEDGKIVGYHSVRKRLERAKINEYETIYEAMRAAE